MAKCDKRQMKTEKAKGMGMTRHEDMKKTSSQRSQRARIPILLHGTWVSVIDGLEKGVIEAREP